MYSSTNSAASIDRAGVRTLLSAHKNRIMNALTAHKDELEKLVEDLSSYRLVSGTTFVALVDAYIVRLDTNCPDINARANPQPAQIDGELTYGTNIESKLRALLRATQNCKTARRVLSKTSRCGRQTSAGCLPATAARRTVRLSNPLLRTTDADRC